MRKNQKLMNLARLATLVQDIELQKLAQARQACTRTRRLLQDLGDTPSLTENASIPDAIIAAQHDQWRLQRRIILNQALARQSAEMLNAKDRATKAFSRAHVLFGLAMPKR